jgi:hypothetical protein
MLARVSNLETFRRWRLDEAATFEDLEARLCFDQPTEAMQAGTAFHAALETAADGEHAELSANGFRFILPDAELELPTIREVRAHAQYGPLTVTGKVDAMVGMRIDDHKTTRQFDAESYVQGYQWRFYLDLFGANTFRWNVFELVEREPRVFEVKSLHTLEQHRYPGMLADCERLARDFYEVVSQRIPNFSASTEE